MFITSFIPLWVSIIIFDIWDILCYYFTKFSGEGKIFEKLISFMRNNIIQMSSIIVIVIVVLSSVYGVNKFLKCKDDSQQKSTGRIIKSKKDNKLSSEFLLAYILPLIAFEFNDLKDIVLFLVYFAILAFLCIRNNNIYTNIMLEFKKYRIYSVSVK